MDAEPPVETPSNLDQWFQSIFVDGSPGYPESFVPHQEVVDPQVLVFGSDPPQNVHMFQNDRSPHPDPVDTARLQSSATSYSAPSSGSHGVYQRTRGLNPSYPTPPSMHRYTASSPQNLCRCGCPKPAILQRTYRAQQQSMESPTIIYFSASGQCGIPVVDALADRFSGLEGRDDAVFADISCGLSITLRFEWPGCPPWAARIRTKDWRKNPRPIVRSKLAAELAKQLVKFRSVMESRAFDQMEDRVGNGSINPDRLVLVALERVSSGSWMPHFRLDV